jgi:type I restriction enzyme S subunit
MEASQFLAEFGHIANAPGGVEKLRNLVLQLAISGRLVTREDPETSVPESLESAADQCRHYAAEMKLRAKRPQSALTAAPYTVPDHWKWVRLEDLSLYIQRGKGPRYADHGSVQVISQKCVQWSGFDHSLSRYVADDSISDYGEERFLKGGDLLWNSTGTGTAGRVAIYQDRPDHKAVADSHVSVIRLTSIANPRYVWCVIASPWVQARIQPSHQDSLVSGTTQQVELNTSTVRALPIPYPPVEEQNRIVEKVEELLNLCSQLERQQQTRRRLQDALRQSTLQAVADAQSPHELQESWQRLEANFSSLSSAPEDIDDFLVELKSLAVRGLLVSSSSVMPDLDRIKDDRTTLKDAYIAKKMMRKQKTVGMAERDTLYPDHWALTAFDDVAIVIGGVTKGRNLRDRQTITCPYLAVANVQRGYLKLDRLKSIEITTEELEKYVVVEGDLLITEGGDWDKVGRTAIWRGEIENCLHQNHVFKARVPSDLLLNEWVELVFNSGVGRDYFAGASKQTTNLASINMTQLRSFPMPIPPVDEQKRILETLSSLTELCEDWRSLLQDRQELSASFANAAIASLTGIATNQKEEAPVKAPQTELIAPLRLGTTPDVTAQAPLTTILARHKGELPARDLWQRFGGEIDAFYAQLKTEVAHGWIAEPAVAEMLEKPAETAGA